MEWMRGMSHRLMQRANDAHEEHDAAMALHTEEISNRSLLHPKDAT